MESGHVEVNTIQILVNFMRRMNDNSSSSSSQYKSTIVFSSIGMAKAALEAMNGFNLYGDKGANWSVVYVDVVCPSSTFFISLH